MRSEVIEHDAVASQKHSISDSDHSTPGSLASQPLCTTMNKSQSAFRHKHKNLCRTGKIINNAIAVTRLRDTARNSRGENRSDRIGAVESIGRIPPVHQRFASAGPL
jgi:hypothetical protein